MSAAPALEKRTIKKVVARLIPLLIIVYFVGYLDRSNISFAKLQMSDDLAMTATAFGFASGIFFIGYVIVEVPSNLALHRFGARKWIARIMITWGIIATLTAFVTTVEMLYVSRFLLGVAEAGLYPGILLYLTYWIPSAQRGKVTGLFLLAVPMASVIGSPLSTWLMTVFGENAAFEGWRAMFFVEGVPALILAVVVWFALTDRPAEAKWLADDERAWLVNTLEAEEAAKGPGHHKLSKALLDPSVLLLCAIYFCLVFGQYALTFFLPTIIQGLGTTFGTKFSVLEIGLLTAVPYACAAIALVLIGQHSDKTGDRVRHVIIPVTIAAIATPIALYLGSPMLALLAICICAAGLFGAYPAFWQLPTTILSGTAAAAGLALVNSVGNIAGFVAPYATGALADATGSYRAPMWVLGGILLAAALLVLVLRAKMNRIDEARLDESRLASAAGILTEKETLR